MTLTGKIALIVAIAAGLAALSQAMPCDAPADADRAAAAASIALADRELLAERLFRARYEAYVVKGRSPGLPMSPCEAAIVACVGDHAACRDDCARACGLE